MVVAPSAFTGAFDAARLILFTRWLYWLESGCGKPMDRIIPMRLICGWKYGRIFHGVIAVVPASPSNRHPLLPVFEHHYITPMRTRRQIQPPPRRRRRWIITISKIVITPPQPLRSTPRNPDAAAVPPGSKVTVVGCQYHHHRNSWASICLADGADRSHGFAHHHLIRSGFDHGTLANPCDPKKRHGPLTIFIFSRPKFFPTSQGLCTSPSSSSLWCHWNPKKNKKDDERSSLRIADQARRTREWALEG